MPADGDLVLMYDHGQRRPGHAGVYFFLAHEGWVLHGNEKNGCSVPHRVRELPQMGPKDRGLLRMGLMEHNLDAGRLVLTPHPVLLDGQTNIAADLRPGESLHAFLYRHVDGLDGQEWHVAIGGRAVPRHMWHHVRPKHGQVIEVRGGVAKTALLIVALIALTIFTAGVGTAMVAAGYER